MGSGDQVSVTAYIGTGTTARIVMIDEADSILVLRLQVLFEHKIRVGNDIILSIYMV